MAPRDAAKRTTIQLATGVAAGVLFGFGRASHAQPSSAFVSIRRAPVKPGSAAELSRRFPQVVLPVLRSLPGFVSFQMIYGENDIVTTVTVYASEGAARDANEKIAPVVREVLGPLLSGPDERFTGTLIASAVA